MPTLHSFLQAVLEEARTLTRVEARDLLGTILADQAGETAADTEIAALLTAMARRGETADELTGFAEAMRAAATPLPLTAGERAQLVDTCGTGGDGHGTFNISTAAALVAAAAGARVAKHGNRAVTSRCGSADVLEVLGVEVALGPEEAVECLRATGFVFLLATGLHPAMRRVARVRRALGFRTIFNLAGPLANPAGAEAQVMGVWDKSRVGVAAEAMSLLGVRHAFVVHGEAGEISHVLSQVQGPGLDELTVTGTSYVAEVRRDGLASGRTVSRPSSETISRASVGRYSLEPEDLGLTRAPLAALGGGGSAAESAAVLLAIFRGDECGARRDIVALNASAALVASGIAADLGEGLARATEAIKNGAALSVLERLRAFAAPKTGPAS